MLSKLRIYLPVADRMGVSQDAAHEEISMHFDEAFWVDRAAHVVDIGFACTFQPCKIRPPEGVQNPR
jgi:hypothetical protein